MMLNAVMLSVVLAASSSVSVKYDGPLSEAIRKIAESGGLNVVMATNLSEPVQVHLTDVSPEEALQTLAKVYNLNITHEGKLWVVRGHKAEAAVAPVAAVAPLPPVPPVPPVDPAGMPDPEDIRDAAERARDEAEAARDRAQEIREQAQEVAQARREEVQARMEEARARADEAKARVDAERDVVATGGPMVVKSGETVESAIASGGPVIVESNAVVEGDAVAFGADVILQDNAVVEGDAVSFGGRVIKEGNARVGGEEVSMGSVAFGKTVAGKAVKQHVEHEKNVEEQKSPGASVGSFFAGFAVLFGLGFVLMMFAPQRMKLLETSIRAEPVKNGVVGFLSVIALLPATVLLLITIIGIPVALLLWVAMALAVPLGLAIVSNSVGSLIPTGKIRRTQALVLAIGVLLMMVVAQIPFVGPLLFALAAMVALGSMVTTRLGQSPRGLAMPDTTFTGSPA